MKFLEKFIKTLLICAAVAYVIGLLRRMPIVGNEYVVTEVSTRGSFTYDYKYKVDVYAVDKNAGAFTVNGNHHRFYTNDLYAIGDTICIGKK